jgi:hypothetical protein
MLNKVIELIGARPKLSSIRRSLSVLGRSSKFREPLGARPTLVVMDRFTNMFDLGGNRKGAEEGFVKPPTPPPA